MYYNGRKRQLILTSMPPLRLHTFPFPTIGVWPQIYKKLIQRPKSEGAIPLDY